MNNWQIEPLDFSVLRFPLLPEHTMNALDVAVDGNHSSIKQSLQALIKLCDNPDMVQAIAFASENLASRIHELNLELTADNLKLAASIYKYLTRMSTRATPFGAFSGVMLTAHGQHTEVNLSTPPELYIRIDNDCVAAIAKRAEQSAIQRHNQNLKVRKNTSLYRMGEELRFVSQQTQLKTNSYQLDTATITTAIEAVLAQTATWITVGKLTETLKQQYQEVDHHELLGFVFDLLQNQLLESDLGIVVSSKNSFATLYQRCLSAQVGTEITQPMKAILDILASQNKLDANHNHQALSTVKQLLADLLPDFTLNRWLHVDSFRTVDQRTLGEDRLTPLLKSVQAIAPFLWRRNTAISEFTDKFVEQYGDAAVPLLEALDVDSGILFGPQRNGRSPLLKGIVPETGQQDFTAWWEPLDTYIMQQVMAAVAAGQTSVQLNSQDIQKYALFRPEPPQGFDDTAAILGTFLQDRDGRPLYQIKNIAGPSALSLLGRFCSGHEPLAEACQTLAAQEQHKQTDAILAEIIHVPQAITANISGRPSLRPFEIVYGPGDSALPIEQQINCGDLFLQVQGGRLVLFSQRLNKAIKPRLASAHNTGGLNLPVYQFLHAFQGADGWLAGTELSRVFATLPYLPEIRIDDLIIAVRRWVLNRVEIKQLHQHQTIDAKLQAFKTLKEDKHICRYVALTEGDNTLEFDLHVPLSVLTLINSIKQQKQATLTASNRQRLDPSFSHGGAVYRQEFVLPCQVKHPAQMPTHKWSNTSDLDVQSMKAMTSLPGERWTYLKLYMGEASADKLLVEQLTPLTQELVENGLVEQWFFIRYADPEFHLRVRFKLPQSVDGQTVQHHLYQRLRVAYQQGLIKSISQDSYMPEVARYGGPEILPVCERLFHLNSAVVCDTLVASQAHVNPDKIRWQMCLHLAWKMACSVCDSLPQMEQFFKSTAAAYDLEFGHNPSIKKQVSDNYRLAMPDVAECLRPEFYTPDSQLISTHILPQFEPALKQLKTLAKQQKVDLFALLQSLIHMDCNRMFVINQRGNEWIAYHYLARYTRTVIARGFEPGIDVAAGFA